MLWNSLEVGRWKGLKTASSCDADAKGRDQRLVEEHFERVGSSDEEEAAADATGAGPSASDSDDAAVAGLSDSDGLIGEDSDMEHEQRKSRKQLQQVTDMNSS